MASPLTIQGLAPPKEAQTPDWTDTRYHAVPFASSTGLRLLQHHSPHYYMLNHVEVTRAMEKGSAMHSRILTPDQFYREFAGYEGARNERHTAYQAFMLEHPNVTVLTMRDFEFVDHYGGEILGEPWAPLFFGGRNEVPIIWTDPESGMPCKAKPDAWPRETMICDLKTLPTLTERAIRNKFCEEMLPLQAVHYLDGLSMLLGRGPIDWEQEHPTDLQFSWLFMPNTPPADEAQTRFCDLETLRNAAKLRRVLLNKLADCYRNNDWPKANPLPSVVNVPSFYFQISA